MNATRIGLFALVSTSIASFACGGATPGPNAPDATNGPPSADARAGSASHACGEHEKVHTHDLGEGAVTEAFVPCARSGGAKDYSGAIKVETIPEGVHILINATDDQVNMGMLGSDVKTRDAVIVYPKGRGSKAVEVPLVKTQHGYTGDKIVMWEELDTITDEGTKIDVAIYDHDGKTGETAEEMHLAVAVSSGKSCQRAIDENPQRIDMSKKGSKADLTNDQLGAPMKTSAFFASCGLSDSADADICVAVKNGKPLGVSVNVTPANNRIAACIDRAARKLKFPESEKLDVVHQKF
jgi:hypothetical protein